MSICPFVYRGSLASVRQLFVFTQLARIKRGGESVLKFQHHHIAPHRTPLHNLLLNQSMDFFATLFSTASNALEAEPTPSTPIDADGGGGTPGCIVA
jgi:hypothetical protein